MTREMTRGRGCCHLLASDAQPCHSKGLLEESHIFSRCHPSHALRMTYRLGILNIHLWKGYIWKLH